MARPLQLRWASKGFQMYEFNPLTSMELLQTMPPNSVDKIEIQGGSRGTRKEGTNASAGVIYIYSRSH